MKKYIYFLTTFLLAAGSLAPAQAQSGYRYPYVAKNADGKAAVIVSRDAKGGVNSLALLSTSEKAFLNSKHADYGTAGPYNKVSPKFEVSSTNNGSGVFNRNGNGTGNGTDGSICPSGYRAATQRELILIYLLKDQLSMVLSGSYWSGTMYSDDYGVIVSNTSTFSRAADRYTPYAWSMNMTSGKPYQSACNNSYNYLCVRDVD